MTLHALGLEERGDVCGVGNNLRRIEWDGATVGCGVDDRCRLIGQQGRERIRQVILRGVCRRRTEAIVNRAAIKNCPVGCPGVGNFLQSEGFRRRLRTVLARDQLRPVVQDRQINPQRVGFGDNVGAAVRGVGVHHPEQDALRTELVAQGFDGRDHFLDFAATVAGEDEHDGTDVRVSEMILQLVRPPQMVDQTKIRRNHGRRGVGQLDRAIETPRHKFGSRVKPRERRVG